jgi:hypothetical protein
MFNIFIPPMFTLFNIFIFPSSSHPPHLPSQGLGELEMLLAQNPGLAEQLRPIMMMMAFAQQSGGNPNDVASLFMRGGHP